jgi:hypothetical protein
MSRIIITQIENKRGCDRFTKLKMIVKRSLIFVMHILCVIERHVQIPGGDHLMCAEANLLK